MKPLTKTLGILIVLQLAFAWTGTLHASIFKCVDGQGQVKYNDKPCPINHDEEELQHSKDPVNSSSRAAQLRALTSKSGSNSTSSVAASGVENDARVRDDKNLGKTALSQNGGVGSGTSKRNNSEQSSVGSSSSNSVASSSNNSSENQTVNSTHKFAALKTY